jgi:hypothetical protein
VLTAPSWFSPFALYRFDASYALEVYAAHPGRFGLVKPVDTADPGVANTVAAWAATKGAVGIRIMLNQTPSADPADTYHKAFIVRLEFAKETGHRNPTGG